MGHGKGQHGFLHTTNFPLLKLFTEFYIMSAEVCPAFDRIIGQNLQQKRKYSLAVQG
jgi:hypothetical protein